VADLAAALVRNLAGGDRGDWSYTTATGVTGNTQYLFKLADGAAYLKPLDATKLQHLPAANFIELAKRIPSPWILDGCVNGCIRIIKAPVNIPAPR
jgi:hypothetical protein